MRETSARGGDGQNARISKEGVIALAIAVVAFSLVSAGIWTERRDVLLDGSLLYLARVTQLFVYFLVAFLFRNHLPSVNRLAGVAVVSFVLHGALDWGMSFFALGSSMGNPVHLLSGVFSGIANATALLVLAHTLSSYSPKYSIPAVVGAYALTEVLFACTALMPHEMIAAVQPLFKTLGLVALIATVRLKRSSVTTACEHPLQYGITYDANAPQKPLRFLVGNADWVFQIIVASLMPFIFGFLSQLLSTDGLSAGLHDPTNEIIAVAIMVALLAFCILRGANIGFNDLFVIVVLLNGTGLMLLPVLWELGSPYAGTLIKCGITVYQALLWALLAHKSFEDPRHTYLYFGLFAGFANVTYGRILEPMVMGDTMLDGSVLSVVSLVFLWSLLMCCLLLFVLQRTAYASRGKEGAGRGEVAEAAVPKDPFAAGIETLAQNARLTPREREVLIEILHGYSMSNVAKKLFISSETVRTHMKNIYQKTGATNKQALIEIIDGYDKR